MVLRTRSEEATLTGGYSYIGYIYMVYVYVYIYIY